MDLSWKITAAAVLGYLVGSVSFALLLARMRGVDLRSFGSGNPGATNIGRALGRKYGVLTYLLDAAKGFLPVLLATLWVPESLWPAAGAGIGAVAGHIWSCFLKFQGGKGVATLTGVMLALAPLTVLFGAIVLFATVWATGYMSLGSILLGFTLPLVLLLTDFKACFEDKAPTFWVAVLSGPLFLYTHRTNLSRLFSGDEAKIGPRRKQG